MNGNRRQRRQQRVVSGGKLTGTEAGQVGDEGCIGHALREGFIVTVPHSTCSSPAETASSRYIPMASVCVQPVHNSARPVPIRATSQPPRAKPARLPPSENQLFAAITSREKPSSR